MFVLALAAATAVAWPSGYAAEEGEPQTITVTGDEFKFTPKVVTVRAGGPVRLVYENDGALSHNLTIPDLGLGTETIQTGESDEIRFAAKDAGQYRFVCTVPGHEEAGMTGQLVVEER